MLKYKTKAIVMNAESKQITDFFANCTDEIYSRWWPDEHIEFHTINPKNEIIGSKVYFDEKVGTKRLKFKALITKYTPGKLIEYQMIRAIRLPAYLSMEFENCDENVIVEHSLNIGFNGLFKFLDPAIKPFVPKTLIAELDAHAKEEFNRLSMLLAPQPDPDLDHPIT